MDQRRDRALNGDSIRFEANDRGRIAHCDFTEGADEVIRLQPKGNGRELAIRRNSPGVLILRREILGNRNCEHSIAPAWEEVRRLAHIWTTRLDPVVRTDRDVQLLFGIAIEIPDEKPAGILIA